MNTLLYLEIGSLYLEILEVNRKRFNVMTIAEQNIKGLKSKAKFGHVDTVDQRTESSPDQIIGGVQVDQFRWAPFRRVDVGERKLSP